MERIRNSCAGSLSQEVVGPRCEQGGGGLKPAGRCTLHTQLLMHSLRGGHWLRCLKNFKDVCTLGRGGSVSRSLS